MDWPPGVEEPLQFVTRAGQRMDYVNHIELLGASQGAGYQALWLAHLPLTSDEALSSVLWLVGEYAEPSGRQFLQSVDSERILQRNADYTSEWLAPIGHASVLRVNLDAPPRAGDLVLTAVCGYADQTVSRLRMAGSEGDISIHALRGSFIWTGRTPINGALRLQAQLRDGRTTHVDF